MNVLIKIASVVMLAGVFLAFGEFIYIMSMSVFTGHISMPGMFTVVGAVLVFLGAFVISLWVALGD